MKPQASIRFHPALAIVIAGTLGAAPSAQAPAGSSRRAPAAGTTKAATPPAATTPTLVWTPDAKDSKNVIKASEVMVNWNPAHYIKAEAVCAPNGASVSFELDGDGNGKIPPMFESHADPTSNGDDLVADVPVRIDGASHVAKAWLTQVKDANVINEMGVLFYEPGIAARVRGEQRLLVRGLGDLTEALVGGAADDQVEEGIRTSAGPLSDLVNARSIRVELPIHEGSYQASLEVNPQHPVLHDFAVRCYERFGGRVTAPASSAAPAPPKTGPSRTGTTRTAPTK
ncbi:MAG TPA: hypothetical protein VL173_00655 [Vicinamibacterales bacterium]|nr:hypothetical protein [Vicinamibacterales bacterium]